MSRRPGPAAAAHGTGRDEDARPRESPPPFPGTDMPVGLPLLLVGLGVPRTVLADLDVVPPESGFLYYVIALAPFAAWLVVAALRPTRRPVADFVVVGLLYGVSLAVVHQALWSVGGSPGHHPPAGAVDLASGFAPAWRDLALRAYASGVAMVIGVGSGTATGLLAWVAHVRRARGARRPRR